MEHDILNQLANKYLNGELTLKRLLLDIQASKGVLTEMDVYHLFTEYNIPLADIEHWVRITKSLEIVEDNSHHIKLCSSNICNLKLKKEIRETILSRDDIAVDEVGCVGLCSLGPIAILDGKVKEDINHNQPFLNFIKKQV